MYLQQYNNIVIIIVKTSRTIGLLSSFLCYLGFCIVMYRYICFKYCFSHVVKNIVIITYLLYYVHWKLQTMYFNIIIVTYDYIPSADLTRLIYIILLIIIQFYGYYGISKHSNRPNLTSAANSYIILAVLAQTLPVCYNVKLIKSQLKIIIIYRFSIFIIRINK